MKRNYHIGFTIASLIVIGAILFYYHLIPYQLIPFFMVISIPFGFISDLDITILGKEFHRHPLFHSIWFTGLCWVLCWGYPLFMVLASMCVFANGLHCGLDIHLNWNKWRGTYCLVIYYNPLTKKQRRMSGFWTTVSLSLSFWISVLILITTLAWVVP